MTAPGRDSGTLLRGLGIGWRPELAAFIAERRELGFVEVTAEALHTHGPLPVGLDDLIERGMPVVPHGVSLGLGGTEPLQPARVAHLAAVAERVRAPLVSEHVAFVRANGLEAGHLLPVPRTREAMDVLVANVRTLSAELAAPLALEHPAALLRWPEADFGEADFLTELAERTGALLLLDLANLHADQINHGVDPHRFLDALPWERVAYIHVAGGVVRDGLYHDTHTHPVTDAVLDLLCEVADRCADQPTSTDHAVTDSGGMPAVMLERDGRYPSVRELTGELNTIATAVGRPPAATGRPLTVVSTPRTGQRTEPTRQDRPTRAAEPGEPGRPGRRDRRGGLSGPDRVEPGRDAGHDGDTAGNLRQAQGELIRALVGGGPAPVGFDPGQVESTRVALLRKRADAVARTWPALSCLPGFHARFAAFADGRPPAGAYADGVAFAHAAHSDLDREARAEQLVAALARRRLARRWLAVATDRRGGGRPLVAIRVPFLGIRVLGLDREND
ncbi:DUF692 domain-containing protein [Protofrankia coriariae]|uniref:DUF692 domain-containing protein n=1 Tax=Protofrankia coriariae TaxID=1562887 RepID=UPI0006406775|nr:DUF692 domain-containing protein [Protofrankia coriariae]